MCGPAGGLAANNAAVYALQEERAIRKAMKRSHVELSNEDQENQPFSEAHHLRSASECCSRRVALQQLPN